MTQMRFRRAVHLAVCLSTLPASAVLAQRPAPVSGSASFVTVGLFIASIEEGARIFTPVRFLPFEHPEGGNHQFPTVLQFHGGEDRLLIALGRQAGLLLGPTLQRYPTQPDTAWPYHPFKRPPADAFDAVPARHNAATDAPLRGLRAVAYLDGFSLAFIVDTRGLSLAARRMERATSSSGSARPRGSSAPSRSRQAAAPDGRRELDAVRRIGGDLPNLR